MSDIGTFRTILVGVAIGVVLTVPTLGLLWWLEERS